MNFPITNSDEAIAAFMTPVPFSYGNLSRLVRILFTPGSMPRVNVNFVSPAHGHTHLGSLVAYRLLLVQRYGAFRWFVQNSGVNLGISVAERSPFLVRYITRFNPRNVLIALHFGANPNSRYGRVPHSILFWILAQDHGTLQRNIRRVVRIIRILLAAGANLSNPYAQVGGNMHGPMHALDVPLGVHGALAVQIHRPLLLAALIDGEGEYIGTEMQWLTLSPDMHYGCHGVSGM